VAQEPLSQQLDPLFQDGLDGWAEPIELQVAAVEESDLLELGADFEAVQEMLPQPQVAWVVLPAVGVYEFLEFAAS
jgi:hypothetical protein